MKYASRNFINRRIAKNISVPWHFLLMSYNRAKKKMSSCFIMNTRKEQTIQLVFCTACIFIVPSPFVGEELYTQMGFFIVQSILADRYIHRREMWVVSLESWSRVEFKNKYIIYFFVFFEDRSFLWTRDICSLLVWFFFKLRHFL